MRHIVLLLWILTIGTQATAQTKVATQKDAYLRCSAVMYIVFRAHPKEETRAVAKQDFDSFTKLGAWFYPTDQSAYAADSAKTLQSIQDDMKTKRMSEEMLVEMVGACRVILQHSMDKFMQCLGDKEVTEEKKRSCAQQSVGLPANSNSK